MGGRNHGRIPDNLAPRWRLTTALIDAWAYPDSPRFVRFLEAEVLAAGARIGRPVVPDAAGQLVRGPWMDVLGVTTEFDYFLSFPT